MIEACLPGTRLYTVGQGREYRTCCLLRSCAHRHSVGFDPNLTAGLFLVKVTHPQYADYERTVEVKPFGLADFMLQRR